MKVSAYMLTLVMIILVSGVGFISKVSAPNTMAGHIVLENTDNTYTNQFALVVNDSSVVGDTSTTTTITTQPSAMTTTVPTTIIDKTPEEIALTESDLLGWTIVDNYIYQNIFHLKFAREDCGEIDQWVYVRSSAEGAEADFHGTHFTDNRWFVDHLAIGDESELWVNQNVAHVRFRVQNVYVEIVLWIRYSDFETTPSIEEYTLWLADVVEYRILGLPDPSPLTLTLMPENIPPKIIPVTLENSR